MGEERKQLRIIGEQQPKLISYEFENSTAYLMYRINELNEFDEFKSGAILPTYG